ncbi:transcriptional regulator [Clostridiales bacterium PH28_bin88]|nr:transcriptional regulator [Clostridiales bacterium PH28_bin88]
MLEQQFTVFKVVAETRNITLAAKRLHMSQPSISLQIQSLENFFGARFFDRTNKGVYLTEAGKTFYQYVCKVLSLINEAHQELNGLAVEKKSNICIGATFTIGEYLLPRILAYMYGIRPDIAFKVKIANTEIIYQDVLEKHVDIGLIEGPVAQHKELVVENFWEDELVVVVPYHHLWGNRKYVSVADLCSEKMIVREQGSGTRKVMELALAERGINPGDLNVTMELGSTQAIKEVVCAGLGITIISYLTVKKECDQGVFRALRIKERPITRSLSILRNATIHQNADLRCFMSCLHSRDDMTKVLHSECCLEGRKLHSESLA